MSKNKSSKKTEKISFYIVFKTCSDEESAHKFSAEISVG